jgi:hypothetical protein
VVQLAREHPGELGLADAPLEVVELAVDLGDDAVVLLGDAELEELLGVVDVARELLGLFDLGLDRRALAGDRLRALGVVPEPRRQGLLVERVDLPFQLGEVKDAPLAP